MIKIKLSPIEELKIVSEGMNNLLSFMYTDLLEGTYDFKDKLGEVAELSKKSLFKIVDSFFGAILFLFLFLNYTKYIKNVSFKYQKYLNPFYCCLDKLSKVLLSLYTYITLLAHRVQYGKEIHLEFLFPILHIALICTC